MKTIFIDKIAIMLYNILCNGARMSYIPTCILNDALTQDYCYYYYYHYQWHEKYFEWHQ